MRGQKLTSTLPFFLVFLSQSSINSEVLTLEHNLTHDFEMGNGGNSQNICDFLSYVKNVKVFSYYLMKKTALRAPFFMAKLQKPESNGYDNHTVTKSSP